MFDWSGLFICLMVLAGIMVLMAIEWHDELWSDWTGYRRRQASRKR